MPKKSHILVDLSYITIQWLDNLVLATIVKLYVYNLEPYFWLFLHIMPVMIRLSRRGQKNKPFYRILVANSKSPIKGKYIEQVGTYNPIKNKNGYKELRLIPQRIRYWIGIGAQPTKTVHRLIFQAGIVPRYHFELLYVIFLKKDGANTKEKSLKSGLK